MSARHDPPAVVPDADYPCFGVIAPSGRKAREPLGCSGSTAGDDAW